MMLITAHIRARLEANRNAGDHDHVPVIKFFNPIGQGIWLATLIEDDGDTLFGMADLGLGCPEAGSFSLAELSGLRLPFGLQIERDIMFTTRTPLSVWLRVSRHAGSLRAAEVIVARHERET